MLPRTLKCALSLEGETFSVVTRHNKVNVIETLDSNVQYNALSLKLVFSMQEFV
jgi:hypothetical protein